MPHEEVTKASIIILFQCTFPSILLYCDMYSVISIGSIVYPILKRNVVIYKKVLRKYISKQT